MKQKRKFLSIFLCLTMVFSIFTASFGTVRAKAETNDLDSKRKTAMHEEALNEAKENYKRALVQIGGQSNDNDVIINNGTSSASKEVKGEDKVRVIVELNSPSAFELAKSRGIKYAEAYKLTAEVKSDQTVTINKVRDMGSIRHTYQNLLNGFSAVVKYKDIDSIKEMPGVKKVTVANVYHMDMNTARNMTNVPNVWKELGYKGEGTVVSIVDTGNDYTHKDMRLTDPSKAKLNKEKVNAMGGPGHFFTDKVPYGYNFADMSDDIIPRESEHGMHVSGIVAANATDADMDKDPTSAIKGVAPEAQLLAMKVFSNNPDIGASAYSDDIAAAIDDSVRHGADVINMSLGSTAGNVNYDDPEQLAIKNAVDAGTIVVVSGGNSYYSTYDHGYNYIIDPDTGVVGSPGLFPDTIQVASIENTNVLINKLNTYIDGKESMIGYQKQSSPDPVEVFGNNKLEAVYVGTGEPKYYQDKDVKGKLVFAVRTGSYYYANIKDTAQAMGAAGIIIRGAVAHGDYVNMNLGTTPTTIPVVSLSQNDGNNLEQQAKAGKKLEFIFTNNKISISNVLANRMSDFSSWGPTPGFGFKPEVTAPGGNIWSTIPNNGYENMSGTSMASPHTAGAMALVVQYLKSQNITAEKRDFVSLAKKLIISTAEPQIDPDTDLPYLTRKQGAGLIKIDKAIKTKAYVTDSSDSPTIAMKNIGDVTNIKLKITNFGGKELTFTPVDNYGVLTNDVYRGKMYTYSANIPGASVSFGSNSVTVPPYGITELNVTMTIPSDTPKDIFAEDFITLKSSDETLNPSIGIPIMAFYGNWDNPRIFDSPVWKGDSFYKHTGLVDNEDYLGISYSGIDPNLIMISPADGDNYHDTAIPYVNLLRNAAEMKVQILDKDGNVVRDIATETNVRKTYYSGGSATAPSSQNAWAWDGKVYNSKTNSYEFVKDGQYTVRLSGKVDGGAAYSTLDMPVKVDNTAPELSINAERMDGKKYKLSFNGSDNYGISAYGVFLNDGEKPIAVVDGSKSDYILDMPNGLNQIAVAAMDYAGNTTIKELTVNNLALVPILIDGFAGTDGKYAKDSIKFGYSIIDTMKASVDHYMITLDKNTAVNNGKQESYAISNLENGLHNVIIDADDKDGNLLAEAKLRFIVDTEKPVININDPSGSETILTNGEKQYTIKFNVKDISGYVLYANNEKLADISGNVGDGSDTAKNYSYTVNIPDVGCKVVIKAVDKLGNEESKELSFKNSVAVPVITITAPTDGQTVLGRSVDIIGNVSYKKDIKVTVKVNGTEAKITEDGKFTAKVTFEKYGENKAIIEAAGTDEKASKKEVSVNCNAFEFSNVDKTYFTNGAADGQNNPPKVTIDYKLAEDNLIDHVNVATDGGEPINNKKSTSVTISALNLSVGKHKVSFEACDKSGNVLSRDEAVLEVDKDLPIINIPDLAKVPIITTHQFEFSGTATEKLQTLEIKTGEPAADTSQEVALGSDGTSFKGVLKNLHEGLNRIKVTMKDLAENVHSYEYKIYVDTTAPVLKLTDPVEDTIIVAGKTYTIKFNVEDNVTGYRVYINGNEVGDASSEANDGKGTYKEFECTLDIPAGNSTFVIKAVDFSGNYVEKTLKFTRNLSGEAAITPSQAEFDVNAPQDISIDVTPDTKGLKSIKNGDYILKAGTDCTISEDKVLLNKDYLSKLPLGTATVIFSFETAADGKLTNEIPLTINVVDKRSNDAFLKFIKVDSVTIEEFSQEKFNYNFEVPSAYEWVPEVSAAADCEKSKVEIAQANNIPGTATITVTAENGTKQTYTVNFINDLIVTKVSSDEIYKVGNQANLIIKVKNQSKNSKQATLIMGLYTQDNEMLQYVAVSQVIDADKEVDLNGSMPIPAAIVGDGKCEIRYFVWDSIDGKKALSKMGIIPVEQNKDTAK